MSTFKSKELLPDFTHISDIHERIDAMCEHAMDERNVDHDISLELGCQAYDLSEEIGYRKGVAHALTIKGYQHWHQTKTDLADQELIESESIQHEINCFDFLGETRMIRAMILWGKGDYEQAFKVIFEGIKIFENNVPNRTQAWLYWGLGVFNYDLKDYEKSLENYNKALSLFELREKFDANTVAYTLIGVGCCYRGLGNKKEAIEYFDRVLSISQEHSQWMQEARCHYEKGLICLEDNDLTNAKKELDLSYEMRSAHGTKPGMVSSLLALTDLALTSGNFNEAEAYMREALVLAEETKSKPKIYQCHRKLYTLYKEKGDFEKALNHNEKYHEVQSEVAGERTSNKLKALETKFATEKSEREAEIQRLKNVELKKAHDLVAEKNREITASIQYAKRIQEAILPSEQYVKDNFPESFIYYQPKDIVAGDFYWLEVIGAGLFFAVADCTGHGVPGAMMSVMCSNALSKSVKELNITSPGKILDKTAELLEYRLAGGKDVSDGMDIVLCKLDFKKMEIVFAGANNPLWIVRDTELIEIKGDKQPIGKYDGRKPFREHVIHLKKGDCIYLFTDGYADQFGGPREKKFKYTALKELLLNAGEQSMKKQKEMLELQMNEWKGEVEQVDDICIAGIRI